MKGMGQNSMSSLLSMSLSLTYIEKNLKFKENIKVD